MGVYAHVCVCGGVGQCISVSVGVGVSGGGGGNVCKGVYVCARRTDIKLQ